MQPGQNFQLAVLRILRPLLQKASISQLFAQKTRKQKGKGPNTFLPLLKETGRDRGKGRRWWEKYSGARAILLDYRVTSPSGIPLLSKNRNGKNVASVSVNEQKQKRQKSDAIYQTSSSTLTDIVLKLETQHLKQYQNLYVKIKQSRLISL